MKKLCLWPSNEDLTILQKDLFQSKLVLYDILISCISLPWKHLVFLHCKS